MSSITPAPQTHINLEIHDVIDTKEELTHHEDPTSDLKWDTVKAEAARGEAFEHEQTLWQAVKYHRKAAGWAAFISLTIIMEAYDGSMGGNFSLFEFRKSFGTPTGDGDYQVSASWMGAINSAPTIGQWIGIPWGTYNVDRMGYRWTFISNLALVIPIVAISVFAQNKTMILMGAMIQGIPFGAFQALTAAFATEMVPLSLRPYSTGGINFCWVFGGLIGSAVIQGTQGIHSVWCWKIPFMTQWIWPLPLALGIYFGPESPWWLVRKGRYEEAEAVLKRISNPQESDHSHETLAQMIRTTAFEKEQAKSQNSGAWKELFRGVDRRRTEIGCMAWAAQNLCGSGFVAGTTYIMEQAGISQEAAFRFGFAGSVISVAGNLVAFYMFGKIGRRTIYLYGLAILFFGLIVIGGCAVAINTGHKDARWAQASIQIVWNFLYVCFLGPPVYAVVGEASSTRLRTKSVSLARVSYFAVGLPLGYLTQFMVNPTAWNWQGKTAFFWCPFCALAWIWAYYRLPEFKGRSYWELDILFARKTPTKQFKNAVVELDADEHIRQQQAGEASFPLPVV